jgi:Cu(I)/Ag(I) efflux system protein CusF
MKFAHVFAAALVAASTGGFAQTTMPSDQGASATATSPMTEAEVRKIDKEQGKVTLRHGPIQNLDMPGMTMVFKVADPKMLDAVKEGDKVKFSAEKVNGAITVTSMEAAK